MAESVACPVCMEEHKIVGTMGGVKIAACPSITDPRMFVPVSAEQERGVSSATRRVTCLWNRGPHDEQWSCEWPIPLTAHFVADTTEGAS